MRPVWCAGWPFQSQEWPFHTQPCTANNRRCQLVALQSVKGTRYGPWWVDMISSPTFSCHSDMSDETTSVRCAAEYQGWWWCCAVPAGAFMQYRKLKGHAPFSITDLGHGRSCIVSTDNDHSHLSLTMAAFQNGLEKKIQRLLSTGAHEANRQVNGQVAQEE